jgi:hypothetical protein
MIFMEWLSPAGGAKNPGVEASKGAMGRAGDGGVALRDERSDDETTPRGSQGCVLFAGAKLTFTSRRALLMLVVRSEGLVGG